jgi:hypothetical protein
MIDSSRQNGATLGSTRIAACSRTADISIGTQCVADGLRRTGISVAAPTWSVGTDDS